MTIINTVCKQNVGCCRRYYCKHNNNREHSFPGVHLSALCLNTQTVCVRVCVCILASGQTEQTSSLRSVSESPGSSKYTHPHTSNRQPEHLFLAALTKLSANTNIHMHARQSSSLGEKKKHTHSYTLRPTPTTWGRILQSWTCRAGSNDLGEVKQHHSHVQSAK